MVNNSGQIPIHRLQGTAWVFLYCYFMLPIRVLFLRICIGMSADSIVHQFYSRIHAYCLEFCVFWPFQKRFLMSGTNTSQQEPRRVQGRGRSLKVRRREPGVHSLVWLSFAFATVPLIYGEEMHRSVSPWVEGTDSKMMKNPWQAWEEEWVSFPLLWCLKCYSSFNVLPKESSFSKWSHDPPPLPHPSPVLS